MDYCFCYYNVISLIIIIVGLVFLGYFVKKCFMPFYVTYKVRVDCDAQRVVLVSYCDNAGIQSVWVDGNEWATTVRLKGWRRGLLYVSGCVVEPGGEDEKGCKTTTDNEPEEIGGDDLCEAEMNDSRESSPDSCPENETINAGEAKTQDLAFVSGEMVYGNRIWKESGRKRILLLME